MKNRELERAQHIHACLDKAGDLLGDYSDRLKGAAAQLMDNGLLQTLAFFHSKSKEYALMAEHVEGWLVKCGLVSGGDPLKALAELDSARYRRCSEEAIAWLNWAKRLALARVAASEASAPQASRSQG
jgi:CRISPR-associated protein Cmr5